MKACATCWRERVLHNAPEPGVSGVVRSHKTVARGIARVHTRNPPVQAERSCARNHDRRNDRQGNASLDLRKRRHSALRVRNCHGAARIVHSNLPHSYPARSAGEPGTPPGVTGTSESFSSLLKTVPKGLSLSGMVSTGSLTVADTVNRKAGEDPTGVCDEGVRRYDGSGVQVEGADVPQGGCFGNRPAPPQVA